MGPRHKPIELGKSYGNFTALELTTHPFTQVKSQCICGTIKIIRVSDLINQKFKSCGCLSLSTKHGYNKRMGGRSMTYNSWAKMIQRCCNPNCDTYSYYGGRGIKVCDRWKEFKNFLEDMGPRPSKDLTLDRINNDGNYEKENCRWATKSIQAFNRRICLR